MLTIHTDIEIKNHVTDSVHSAAISGCSGIEVAVEKGIVTLSGICGNSDQKLSTGDMVRTLCGVKGVRNDIRIILPRDGGQYDDGSIVAAIEVQLLCHPVFDIKKLRINSLKGNVRIGGTADEYWKRDGITRLVSSVGGITGLDNKIRIIPKQWQSDFNILRSIKETLHHQDKSSAEKIKLSVRAGCVHITGMVETASCFKMVEQIVEYTPGVCNVLNELMVK